STGWAYHACLNLNYSNRPVRTRMPGGVAGDRSAMLAAPMPIPRFCVGRAVLSLLQNSHAGGENRAIYALSY
ncbi:hypothetical protein, partial [Rugamonas fusca]|uniref:hypothetical protein n=1 Tax=Rugamonas fusca TaxID=2758568 RepID=UPI001C713E6A